MEATTSESNNNNYDISWNSTTNWTIANGSLVDSIFFDSSLSPTVNDDDDDNGTNSLVKTPLILNPPSPHPLPCDITITFEQKHKVRQVYVRSTARVYEIYFASVLGGSNEYLCTVRCGVVTREEEVLCTPHSEEAFAHLQGSSEEYDQKKRKSESSLNTNEDDWVEVKPLDSSRLDSGNCPPPSSVNAKQVESLRDLYEATAEINDAEPCMSITLRMLSLQKKSCIFVDEVYVFGDPVETSDSENRVGEAENPTGSSIMAMFMPTLMQLSKLRNAEQVQCDRTFDSKAKHKCQEISSKATDSVNVANNIKNEWDPGSADEQDEKLLERAKATATPACMKMPAQVADTARKPDSSSSHIEEVLNHLVLRVSRVEDCFLRLEERILKPLNSIDARLQTVEQQLEELSKKSCNSGLQCTRFSAPEFSWHESDDNFLDRNEKHVIESDEKGCTVLIPAEDETDSSNDCKYNSSLLVVTDPASNAYDDENINALEAAMVSANDKSKQVMSVDEALASALAGFLSSGSAKPQNYSQVFAIKSPEFPVDEDSTSEKNSSPEVEGRRASEPSVYFHGVDITEFTDDSLPISSNIPCLESEVEVTRSVDDEHSDKADALCLHNGEGKDDSPTRGIIAPASLEVATERLVEVADGANHTFADKCGTLNQFLENQSHGGSGSMQLVSFLNSESSTNEEVVKDQSENDALQDLKISCPCVVDFELPILDVKFVYQETSNGKFPFDEILLDGQAQANAEAPRAKEDDDGSQIFEQGSLILVDDTELDSPASGNHLTVDMNYCNLDCMPLYSEGEELHKEACTSSLI